MDEFRNDKCNIFPHLSRISYIIIIIIIIIIINIIIIYIIINIHQKMTFSLLGPKDYEFISPGLPF